MYCTRCAHELPDGARFCPECAAPVASVAPTAKERRPRSRLPVIFVALLSVLFCIVALAILQYEYWPASYKTIPPIWALVIGGLAIGGMAFVGVTAVFRAIYRHIDRSEQVSSAPEYDAQ